MINQQEDSQSFLQKTKGSPREIKIIDVKGVNKYSAGFVPAALEEGGVGTPRYLRDATEAKSPLTSGSHRPMKSPN